MAMIGHHDRAGKLISRSIEIMQAIKQSVSPARVAKLASPMAFVKPRFAPTHDLAGIGFQVFLGMRLGMGMFPV